MRIVCDHFSLTGAMHIPEGLGCQDYAVSGTLANGAAYAVVCDGSSCADKSGKPDRHAKTSVGASILALATARAITNCWTMTGSADTAATETIRLQQQLALPPAKGVLGLKQKDMAATCLYAFVSPAGGVIHIQGDGAVVLRKRDGSMRLLKWDWPNSGPFYPAYALDSDLLRSFVESKGGYDAEVVEQQEWFLASKDAEPESLGEHKLTVRQGLKGIILELTAEEIAELEGIFLFSDGIDSVCEGNSPMNLKKLDWKLMVKRMLNLMQHPLPDFAMARLARWQQRDVEFLKAVHQDDLTMSAIRLIHESNTN